MKKTLKWTIIFIPLLFFFAILILYIGSNLGTGSLGTGSYKYARRWKAQLATCNSLDDVRQQFNCGRYRSNPGGSFTYIRDPNTISKGRTWALLYEFPNGDWMAITYASSHGARGGGTVVTRDNKGAIRIFFGHVCGKPFAHGESLNEVYSDFHHSSWKEIFLNE